jgi:hypothetical protein
VAAGINSASSVYTIWRDHGAMDLISSVAF